MLQLQYGIIGGEFYENGDVPYVICKLHGLNHLGQVYISDRAL